MKECQNPILAFFLEHPEVVHNQKYPIKTDLKIEIRLFLPSIELYLSDIREMRNNVSNIGFV